MSRIRGADTDPEIVLRRRLHAEGFRYRLRMVVEGIRPDLVFPGRRAVVFVDGCFWHGCPDHYVRPRTRTEFWDAKLRTNVDRDRRQTNRLEAAGWLVLRFWEHAIMEDPGRVVDEISRTFREHLRAGPDWRVVRVEVLSADADLERRTTETLRGVGTPRTEVRKRTTQKWKRHPTAS